MSLKTLGSNGFQMKRVASTAMLNSTKTECKKRLVEILLSNNLNLLVIICQSPLLNESHSTLPKSILKLLMAYRENSIETFIIRLLSYKAKMYRIKNRDSCDILRDNSFLSTLLNTYAHEIGYRYLTSTLSSTIKDALVYSKDLELDPNRIKKKLIAEQSSDQQQLLSPQPNETISMTMSTMSTYSETLSAVIDDDVEVENEEELNLKVKQIINNNIAKIENICLSFLNCIINNKEKMPNKLHHLCFSIANVVEYSYNQEYDGNELTDYGYVSRQNSDLSMFNILNYNNNDNNSTTSIPFSMNPASVDNYTYDDKGSNLIIDTQNIYNQNIYNSNPMQSNGSLNTNNGSTISASPSRNSFNHKKYETYTAGITYNVGFNNLKQAPSNISTNSNIMDSECKYADPINRSNSASLERLDIDTKCIEVKPDDQYIIHSAPIIESRNSKDRDKLIKQQRRYNVFNNDFYSKNFKIQNINQYLNSNQDPNQNRLSYTKRILSSSDENLICRSPTCNSLSVDEDDDNARSYKSHSNHTSFRISDEELLTLSEMLKLDMDEIYYEHLKDRNNYRIEEEEDEMMKKDKNSKGNNSNSGKNNSSSHNKNKETNEGMEIIKNKDEIDKNEENKAKEMNKKKNEMDELDMATNRLEILNIINSLDSNNENVLNRSESEIAETKDDNSEASKNDKSSNNSDTVDELNKDNEIPKTFPLKRESISFNYDSRKSSRTDFEKSDSFLHPLKKGSTKLSESNDDEEVEEERYFVSLNDVDDKDSKSDSRRQKMEKQGSRFFEKSIEYTNSEKVVGTFLFLRFFVPAITSPESIGLTSKKISTSDRKSLIVCGKVLTSLCNNVNFGGKEKYMEYLNPFLQVHREEARDFLQWAISYNDDQLPIINVNINDNILMSPKITKPINDLDVFSKKYGSEYSSENSSYASLNIPEPNSPSGRNIFDNRQRNRNDGYISPITNRASPCRLGSFSEEGFNSLPILTADSNSSIDKLSIKERNLLGSKGSVVSNKPNYKNGFSQIKFVPLNDTEPSNSVRNINTTDLKKDYDAEIKDITSFLSKNIHILEKEIDERTKSIPEEELEGVYSGFIELKQLIFLSEDNNTMKTWFKKIFKSKYGSSSMDNLLLQKTNKSRRSSNNNILK